MPRRECRNWAQGATAVHRLNNSRGRRATVTAAGTNVAVAVVGVVGVEVAGAANERRNPVARGDGRPEPPCGTWHTRASAPQTVGGRASGQCTCWGMGRAEAASVDATGGRS